MNRKENTATDRVNTEKLNADTTLLHISFLSWIFYVNQNQEFFTLILIL